MKIKDLNKYDRVVVHDLGKSEYSEGMRVVGNVTRLANYVRAENEEQEDGYTVAVIEQIQGIEYVITDNNYFDLWSKSIEGKTEHIRDDRHKSVRWIDENTLQTNLGYKINITEDMFEETEFDLDGYVRKIINELNRSNDVQQRKRNKKIVQWSDDTKLKFIERAIQDLSPLAAYHIGNAIDVLAVAESKEDIEQARWSIQRAYENWD